MIILDKIKEKIFQVFGETVTGIDHLNPGIDNTNDIYCFYTQKSAYILKITKDMHTNGQASFWLLNPKLVSWS